MDTEFKLGLGRNKQRLLRMDMKSLLEEEKTASSKEE